MKQAPAVFLCVVTWVLFSASPAATKSAHKKPFAHYKATEIPMAEDPPDPIFNSIHRSAPVGTTLLGWWQFDTATGTPDQQGWTKHDLTALPDTMWHVDGSAGGGPGCCPVTPVNGLKSMWCGACPSTDPPYCGFATLPGYGNLWDQRLTSQTLACTTLTVGYTIVWDSEPGYDYTYVEYWDDVGQAWVALPVNNGQGSYDGIGGPLVESFNITPLNATTSVRFRFTSDGAWDDQDGLWPTNEGGVKIDDVSLSCPDAGSGFNYFEDWEGETCGSKGSNDGMWQAAPAPGYGIYAELHSGAGVLQTDPCERLISNLWGFFDDPANTNYACGGYPLQGAVPYGPDDDGLYLGNEVWSPKIPYVGNGDRVRFSFTTYRDLPLDNLIFYIWHIRSWVDNCPKKWQDFSFGYYGGQKDWIRSSWEVGSLVEAGATDLQLTIGAWDMCRFWCGVYGTGSCHSHAPLVDQVRLVRVDLQGPQWNVRHIDLFHDNFPEDGTVTGFARADMAQDMLPSAIPSIIPADSIAFEVTDPNDLDTDPQFGGPSVYVFARVVDRFGNDKGIPGAAMESPDVMRYVGDVNALKRYPYCGSNGNPSAPAGLPAGWHQFRCDRVYTISGGQVYDRFCGDFMDVAPLHVLENAGNTGQFVPGDVVRYFLGAKNTNGIWSYWHRTFDASAIYTMEGQGVSELTLDLATAYNAACEFSILPDAGLYPGDQGDILFVDDADDRGGPAQLYFDWCLYLSGILDRVDRFDVLGPSSQVGNSLASRVKNYQSQLIGDTYEIYQSILWNSSNLSAGLVCDGSPPNGGSGPDKSLDWTALKFFMDFHPNDPGCFFAGDDLAEEWNTLAHSDAIAFRGTYMNYILTSGNHAGTPGLPVSPTVYRNTGMPIGPDAMVAYGGCPAINDFDVMAPGGPTCQINSSYDVKDGPLGAVMRQTTPTAQQATATVFLGGFGFNYIRDDGPSQFQDRCAFLQDILTYLVSIIPNPIGIENIAFENRLDNAYPNPFNPTTTIKYSIKQPGHVSLKIYNVAGQLVRTLVDETQTPREGGFSEKWNGANNTGGPVSSGVYFYKLTAEGFTQTKRMVLLK